MPEGDTIFRTARTLDRWLRGREITRAHTKVAGLPVAKLVGQRVDGVEARAKHLLVRFDSGSVLHTHMRMTGSWHVYRAGERWRKPGDEARLVLEAGDRAAVCFNAPVVELLAAHGERVHPSLSRLGPDVLVEPFDLDEVRRRASTRPVDLTVGELLLDQQIVSGIGNIYRCESLFRQGLNPWTPRNALDAADLDALVTAAATMMRGNLEPGQGFAREFGEGRRGRTRRYGPDQPYVYRRAGRPCYRCRRPIRSARLGEQAREVYWCDACQPLVPAGVTSG
jgi:endonuclease-8